MAIILLLFVNKILLRERDRQREKAWEILFFFYEAMINFIFIFNHPHSDPIRGFYALLVAIWFIEPFRESGILPTSLPSPWGPCDWLWPVKSEQKFHWSVERSLRGLSVSARFLFCLLVFPSAMRIVQTRRGQSFRLDPRMRKTYLEETPLTHEVHVLWMRNELLLL